MSTNTSTKAGISPQEARAFMLSSIAISTGIFGIAFWYGVFGTVFFEHLFYLWVASTVALVASMFVPPVDALPSFMSWRGRFVLALPTVWMVMAGVDGSEALNLNVADWVEWTLTIATLILTLPYLLYVLVLVAVPDIEALSQPRLRIAIWMIALAIALAGYSIGANHSRFLTCFDFQVSGSNIPVDCRNPATSGDRAAS